MARTKASQKRQDKVTIPILVFRSSLRERIYDLHNAISYWASSTYSDAFAQGKRRSFYVFDELDLYEGTRRKFVLDEQALADGIALMAQAGHFSASVGRLLSGDGDRNDLDRMIQFACFGEIVYG